MVKKGLHLELDMLSVMLNVLDYMSKTQSSLNSQCHNFLLSYLLK